MSTSLTFDQFENLINNKSVSSINAKDIMEKVRKTITALGSLLHPEINEQSFIYTSSIQYKKQLTILVTPKDVEEYDTMHVMFSMSVNEHNEIRKITNITSNLSLI